LTAVDTPVDSSTADATAAGPSTAGSTGTCDKMAEGPSTSDDTLHIRVSGNIIKSRSYKNNGIQLGK